MYIILVYSNKDMSNYIKIYVYYKMIFKDDVSTNTPILLVHVFTMVEIYLSQLYNIIRSLKVGDVAKEFYNNL